MQPLISQPTNILRSQRSPLDARRDGMDDCKLLFQISGRSTLTQDERTTELAAGDLGFIDITRPVSLAFHQGPGRLIGLHLPRRPLKSHLGFEPQGGWCWRRDALPVRLLQRLILEAIDDRRGRSRLRRIRILYAERRLQSCRGLVRHVGFAAPFLSRRQAICSYLRDHQTPLPGSRCWPSEKSLPKQEFQSVTFKSSLRRAGRHVATMLGRYAWIMPHSF